MIDGIREQIARTLREFGLELPRSSKIPRNSHINRRKKEKKLPTDAIMKKLD
jgi:hypothetical protein